MRVPVCTRCNEMYPNCSCGMGGYVMRNSSGEWTPEERFEYVKDNEFYDQSVEANIYLAYQMSEVVKELKELKNVSKEE